MRALPPKRGCSCYAPKRYLMLTGYDTILHLSGVWSTLSLPLPYLPNPSTRAGYDTRSIFKRSLTGLNSEFSFSWTSLPHIGWRTQCAELFTHSWRENNWIHTFPKVKYFVKCNQPRPGFELMSPCPLPTAITITPRAPPLLLPLLPDPLWPTRSVCKLFVVGNTKKLKKICKKC